MRLYAQVSGAFFSLVTVGHVIRAVMRWPVQVADVAVPVWASVCAVLFMAGLATWAFRTASRVVPR